MDLARILVRAQPLTTEGHELVWLDLLRYRHEGNHLFAVQLVGASEHARSRDRGVLAQRLLDVAREHVEAAAKDQILLAVEDREVALVVEPAHVAGVEPAVADGL